ncbi:MAG: LPS export ABC transporter periplasmic protein LptC [Vogesella sp.]|uniref:LPS export ABC transporter periplasmic protein LptC n=1 Tax=Vogesella sp. TaxID=1904252 RepID=UPI003919CF30
MNRVARLFPIGLMLGMGLLAFWLNVLTEWRAPAQRQLNPNEPEYTIERLTATRFDEQGRLQQQLATGKMWKLPEQEQVYLQQMDVKQFRDGQLDYQLRAERGVYNRRNGEGQFDGNVNLVRQARADQRAVYLQTATLQLNTQTGIMRNQAPVAIDDGLSRIRSNGFYYNHPAGQLKLLSSVRITYAP